MTKITLTNSFHKTEITITLKTKKTKCPSGEGYKISSEVLSNIKKTLCNVDKCTCGINYGQNEYILNSTLDANYLLING